MALLSPRQLPLKIVLLLAIFSLLFLNAGGWYLYNLALAAIDERMAAQLWSIGRTAALDVEASGFPELLDLVGEDWPDVASSIDPEDNLPVTEAAFLDTLSNLAAYLAEAAQRNGLERLMVADLSGRVLFDSAGEVSFGQADVYLPLDGPEVEAAARGEETATVAYPVGGTYYKRAYVPVNRYQESGASPSLILGMQAGASQFREMEALRDQLWLVALVSAGVGVLLLFLVYGTIRRNLALERSTERARRALEMGQMTAAVAHEIRNPLSIIQTNAECLRSAATDPAAREAAADILEETERLGSIVHRFMGLSGAETGKVAEESPGEVDLLPFLESLVTRYAHRIEAKGATINMETSDVGGRGCRVEGRGEVLASIFQNLFDNAADAVGQGDTVRVQLSAEGELVRVVIEDTGTGMTREEAEAALQPFHSTKQQGIGIGLPLAKSLVEKIGGSLTLRSHKGSGTRVIVELPRAR